MKRSRIFEEYGLEFEPLPGRMVAVSRSQLTRLLDQYRDNARILTRRHEKIQRKLVKQATKDPLTGLHNRRFIGTTLNGLQRIARRRGYAVIMGDLDEFKDANDTYGHTAGDIILKHAARILKRKAKRSSDHVLRYGGEEFLMFLGDCRGIQQAAKFAEMLRRSIQESSITVRLNGKPVEVKITCSFGVAVFTAPSHGKGQPETLDMVIHRADQALYTAKGKPANGKKNGPREKDARNRVCFDDGLGHLQILPRSSSPKRAAINTTVRSRTAPSRPHRASHSKHRVEPG